MSSIISPKSTSLAITNPLVLYRALLARNLIEPNPAQHRLAIHLQTLYHSLKDYTPSTTYNHRLEQVRLLLDTPPQPRFLFPFTNRPSLSLTRILSSHDAALALSSPRGLLLHGDVGTGKSMLIDLLASSLPSSRKRRWHFNAFMLDVFARLERLRISRQDDGEHSLVRLARELALSSPILFLDEFQLPDRAAARILKGLLTAFFQMGGVLVATSNRMPEELAGAAGVEYVPSKDTTKSGGKVIDGRERAGQTEFMEFLDVLKARCETWEIEGQRDYRRPDSSPSIPPPSLSGPPPPPPQPLHYHTTTTSSTALHSLLPSSALQPHTLTIHSRPLHLPKTHPSGILLTPFSALCSIPLGPADYLAISRTFHTILLTSIPALTPALKPAARRFITLLDALYEAGCRLAVHADVPLEELFFSSSNTITTTTTAADDDDDDDEDVEGDGDGDDPMILESFSEINQDLSAAAFRAHVAVRAGRRTALGDMDEDADFTRAQERVVPFTGLDERFAARRAESRLWQMCGEKWWAEREGGKVGEWWVGGREELVQEMGEKGRGEGRDEGLEMLDAEREAQKPRFAEAHFWGLGLWGKRAGRWGQGTNGSGDA